ncbi:MAG TPA: hypothetical protein VK685_09255 [Candidatus Acidoferrum sp.]|jgi:hypothetical protein|nr:hypothetical protein [Candidatus Acidoferrum sp.]
MALLVKQQAAKSLGPLFGPLYLFYLLVDDLKSWRYLPKWLSSCRPGRSLIGAAKPWIPYEAANWLEHYLNRNCKVFEWGSGGSTIFLSERAGQVFSIEHDKKWHTRVSKALAQFGITNCSYQLHEPKPIAGTFSALDESQSFRFIYDDYYPGTTVDEYVRAIDVHPDYTFDLVLVDGLVRTQCIQHAISKVRPGGYLMLDNSNNAEVAEIVRKLQTYPHTVFRGIAPGWPPARWSNTIWRIS